ncbi:hypothetical protein NLU14_03250 [Marinobacter sp. 71-i]|uniref:Uncharacterized protein n=1 Tax=Marinobacter iranensis TaxID=2962607 RepID=A0ABT5Y6P5_9GAMM|nr:hypothetical protein [Marinobacter iranensis]MDF0749239.1 hypothetical protein [Marinobacter iranensis]
MNPRLIAVLAVLAAVTAVAIYGYQFNGSLSPDHSRWGEFGSFFGGVLGATFAFFTLMYLAKQVENQWKESKAARLELEMSQRERYVASCLGLLLPKLKEIDEAIDAPLSQLILRAYRDEEQRRVQEFIELLREGLSARSAVMALWVNVSSALSFLEVHDEVRYLNQKTLVAVQVGYDLCRALDETVSIATEIDFERHFDR